MDKQASRSGQAARPGTRYPARFWLWPVIGISLSGCASNSTELITSSLNVVASQQTGSPIETYSRIARGANTCWFGANGPLKYTHILHADAKPAGEAEIAIHERVTGQPSPLGYVAFRVRIRGSDTHSDVAIENLKMTDDVGGLMRTDVDSWGRGGHSCSGTEISRLLKPTSGVPLPERRPGRPRKR